MATSRRLTQYLDSHQIQYQCYQHSRSMGAYDAAKLAHIPATCMVKAVILKDKPAVKAFIDFTQTPAATEMISAYGYDAP